jgi:hypothetical protein
MNEKLEDLPSLPIAVFFGTFFCEDTPVSPVGRSSESENLDFQQIVCNLNN